VVQHLAAVSNGSNQAAKAEKPKTTNPNKFLDFLSTSGKLSVFLLAITPLPTYIGVWGKTKAEQVQRVESISFAYLLLNILCSSVWTSYAFKTQNIDLAIISVFPLVIAIILCTIYLSV
jgi:tryptophan-rich sensory protein